MEAFDRLIDQIDAFIRKFYKNQMIKGLILFLGVFLLSFLLTTTLEYFGHFGSITRAVFLFSFLTLNAGIFIQFICIPLLKLYSFGSRINRLQASEIIGKFFPSISDRLKNTLQLNESLSANEGNLELIRASVVQRSSELSVVPFGDAIKFGDNRKYVKYVLPIFVVFVVVGVAAPSLFKQGTERVLNYSKEFKPIAPFQFILDEHQHIVEEGKDLELSLRLKGSELPDHVYLISENGKFLMTRTAKNRFVGTIKKPKRSGSFYFEANDFESDSYGLVVFGKASIGRFSAKIHYPEYLERADETIENAGDMILPEGTQVEWNIVTKNTASTVFKFNGQTERFSASGFRVAKKLLNNSKLELYLSNKHQAKIDSSETTIEVIKDAFPAIQVEETKDSVADGVRYFNGNISDDHGLKALNFVYAIVSEDGKRKENKLSVRKVFGSELPFDFAVDFRRENVTLNDRIEYYFVVSDNDGVNGSKSTRSQVYTYKLPSLDELNEKREEDQQNSRDELNDLVKKAQEFQKRVDKLKKEAMNTKSNDWNKLNQVNQLKEEQKSMLESLEQLQKQMEQSVQEKDQLSEMDKELLEKQEMIEKLLEELMDDELRKLLDDLEKLMEKNDKEELKEKLDDLEQSSEDMKKQLDRSLEMLKRLQVNEKIDDIEKELKELAQEQEKLKKEIENDQLTKEKSVEKQEKLNKKFEEIKNDLQQMKELNKSLEDPMEMGDTEAQENKISEDMNESKESLDGAKKKKASEKQQSASDEMKGLAEQLDQMQQQANQQQEEEDMNLLRNILESLMILSFDQEDLMRRFQKIQDTDPAYRRYGRKQRSIVDDTKIVRDSLYALAKRQPKIASFIDKELNTIKENHDLCMDDIDEHRKRDVSIRQQTVMTSYNNLALLLNESLQSMQQQMQSKAPGSGSCNKPGGKGSPKPGNSMKPGDMKQMLKKQLEQMQKGPSPGGNKPGEKPGGSKPGGEQGMNMLGLGNKEIAKMAAEQTAIRQRLEQLRNELNKEGQGKGNQLNPLIKELEQQEKDLINKRFSNEMIKRQQNILTRLLESEKALMERGFEEKRESKSGKNINYSNQIRFEEYNRQKLKQIELLRPVDPVYKKYYKDKANEYFNLNF